MLQLIFTETQDFWPLAVSAFLLLLVVFVTTKRMSGLPMAGYLMQ